MTGERSPSIGSECQPVRIGGPGSNIALDRAIFRVYDDQSVLTSRRPLNASINEVVMLVVLNIVRCDIRRNVVDGPTSSFWSTSMTLISWPLSPLAIIKACAVRVR